MELAGVVSSRAGSILPAALQNVPVVKDIRELQKVDAALLCVPTRRVKEFAQSVLPHGIRTVDSFDIHTEIAGLRGELSKTALRYNTVSVVAAGWDPGSDSVIRALMQAAAPRGVTYTDFGPGMSMGHTVAAKAIDGVADALSLTIPLGTGIHRRNVYVQLKEGADFKEAEKAIKSDPYFSRDETHVYEVKEVSALKDTGHGVKITRKGTAGITDNQRLAFDMRISGPALTAQIMTACARAAMKRQPGAYTMIELPLIDLLPGNREDLIRQLV
jgi:diaminopimelate dehydrogenase